MNKFVEAEQKIQDVITEIRNKHENELKHNYGIVSA